MNRDTWFFLGADSWILHQMFRFSSDASFRSCYLLPYDIDFLTSISCSTFPIRYASPVAIKFLLLPSPTQRLPLVSTMKLPSVASTLILWLLLQLQFGAAARTTRSSTAIPTSVSGIQTVTTGLATTVVNDELCSFGTSIGYMNGKEYYAAYAIEAETTTSTVFFLPVHYRQFTLTWYFNFASPVHASDFRVYKAGFDIHDIAGVVNLEEGSFIVSYKVEFPLLTYISSVIS